MFVIFVICGRDVGSSDRLSAISLIAASPTLKLYYGHYQMLRSVAKLINNKYLLLRMCVQLCIEQQLHLLRNKQTVRLFKYMFRGAINREGKKSVASDVAGWTLDPVRMSWQHCQLIGNDSGLRKDPCRLM